MTDKDLRAEIARQFMLATETNGPTGMFSLPLLAQPKLNGIRARWVRSRRAFYSRDGVRFADAITSHIKVPDDLPYDLDGEFYVHGWPLQRINSAISVNRLTATADTPLMEFHAFDIFARDVSAHKRLTYVAEVIKPSDRLRPVQFKFITSAKMRNEHYLELVAAGYEGAIYRWPTSVYTPGLSNFMLKRKAWIDSEFEIVGYEEGDGRLKGTLGAFVCSAGPGLGTFNVGGGMTDEERNEFWEQRIENIGRMVKVKHLGRTESGSVVHPQFLALL